MSIAYAECAYPEKDSQAELSWMAMMIDLHEYMFPVLLLTWLDEE